MTGRTHLIIPDCHAHPEHNNDRADLLANLIINLQPDVVVNMGDQWDFPSLSSYDKGKRSFHGRSYRADLNAGLEFSERLWGPVKARKKKLPFRVFLEGNHEHRIEKALDLSPELTGTIGFNDLDLDRYYDLVVRYNGSTPGQVEIDGIEYAHYFPTGVSGYAISGVSPAKALVDKRHRSSTAAHSHLADWFVSRVGNRPPIMGLVAGVFQDYDSEWAGELNKLWWRGVVICHDVEDGHYDPQFVSLERLRRTYG